MIVMCVLVRMVISVTVVVIVGVMLRDHVLVMFRLG